MDMIVGHNGKEWVATGGGVEVRGCNWEELDRTLQQRLAEQGMLSEGNPVQVCMRFDMDGLPRRLHQYSSHYFNRIVRFSV
ncbi:MAG: DUF5395 family protein [Gammaproteobacteria bacterium]